MAPIEPSWHKVLVDEKQLRQHVFRNNLKGKMTILRSLYTTNFAKTKSQGKRPDKTNRIVVTCTTLMWGRLRLVYKSTFKWSAQANHSLR
eukprot:2098714-Amphidinium_carterae.1